MKTSVFATLLLMTAMTAAKDLTPTNLNRVFGAGTQTSVVASPQVMLKPGVYAVGDEDHQMTGTHYLIVDEYVNDDSQSLALLVNQHQFNGGSRASGQFYLVKPIKRGQAVMLSPVFINSDGVLSIQSELNRDAQVLEISISPDGNKYRYPYVVQGHNGALDGKLMGMRAKSHQEPKFRAQPSSAIFTSETDRGQIVVSGKTVSIHNGRNIDQRFEMLPLNGDLGRMAALVSTKFDTMMEESVSQSHIERLAFFMTAHDGDELFIIAQPAVGSPGTFIFDFYGPRGRKLLDYIAKGKLQPEAP